MKQIVIFAAVALCSYAQPGRGSFIQFHPLLSALDGNHDNVIDAAELARAPDVLRSLDRNQDGRITADELFPAMGRGRGGAEAEGPRNSDGVEEAVKTYLAFDKNGDGRLTRDEVPERMQGIFARADTDKDGVLSADELRSMARAQQPADSGRGGREGFEGRFEGRGRGPGRMDPIFSALDTNQDNAITGDEITNAATALKTLDRNADGKLSEDELRPSFGPGRGRG